MNWEQMKDFSYVGIKLTKAKSITQGLNKCKVDKLTRRNPIYEHIELHKVLSDRKICNLCSKISLQHNYSNTQQRDNHIQQHQHSKTLSAAQQKSPRQKINSCIIRRKLSTHKSMQSSVSNRPYSFTQIISRFEDSLSSTRKSFYKICKHQEKTNQYFMTQMNDIQVQLEMQNGFSLREVKTDRAFLKQQELQLAKKRKKQESKVKQLNKPIKFPFNQEQMKFIISKSNMLQAKEGKKLKKCITSLYDYKSKMNHLNKVKIINIFHKT